MAILRSAGGSSFTRFLSILISPPLTVSRPAMMRSNVDLPQPDGPTKTTNSPSSTDRLMSRRISVAPKDLATPWRETSAIAVNSWKKLSLHGTGSEAAHEITGEEKVKDENRGDCQRQGGEHRIPVRHVLADELLHTERDRLLAVAGRQDQREPQVVPDRHHGEHRHRRDGRADQRQDDAEEDPVYAHPVASGRIAQILRDLLDELAEDQDRERQPLRHIDEDEGCQSVDEVQLHHHAQDADAPETDRHHDADGEIKAEDRIAAEAVFRQRPGRHCPDEHD